MSSDQTLDHAGALAVLREAMRASPVPSADILGFAVDCCSAAGFPPTTPELDDKLRALGLLFGKAAPGPADLTHFLWHVLDGSIPRPLLQQALEQALGREFKGLAGDKVRAVLEAVAARPTDIYGNDLIKNLGLILRSVAHRAIDMTTAGLEGSVAAERAERVAAMSTIRALEADLTKIARAYYGEEAPTGVAADGIAEFIRSAKSDLVTISTAYCKATNRGDFTDWTAKAIAEHITAMTGSDKALAWFQDIWSRTSGLEQGAPTHGFEKWVLVGAPKYAEIERQNAGLRAEVENLQGLLEADKSPEWLADTEPLWRAIGMENPSGLVGVAATALSTITGLRSKLAAMHGDAHAARWLKTCKLLGWDTEADPAISSDGIGKMTAFMERMQALLVKPLRDELRSRQAPNLAAFGYEKATPERVVELAAERIQADAREIGRLRAANRDLSAKIESAPGSGLRKRLAVAERIAGHPGELERWQVELEKIQSQIREAKAQRDAVLAAARKDPTGASIIKDMQAEIEQHRKDCTTAEQACDAAVTRYNALALAVCPFPKDHESLLKQAAAARDRAMLECAKGLPDGYRIEEAWSADQTLHGWRWTVGSGTWGETVEGPGYAVRLAWQRLVSQIEAAHREAVRHAEKRLAELEGPAPIRSVLIAAVEALGWTPAAGDPEDWAIAEGCKLAVDRKALSDLRGIMIDAEKREAALLKERATLIGDLLDIALEVDQSLEGEALLERIRQIVHDAAACEPDRRQIDATQVRVSTSQHPVGSAGWIAEMGPHVRTIRERHGVRLGELARHLGCEVAVLSTFELGEVMGAAQPLGTAAMDALQAQPGPTARGSDKPSPVQDIRIGADEVDMQRIKDLLHERRARMAMRDGEACTWPELVKGLIDDSFTADLNEGHMAGKLKHAEERAAACAAIVSELEAQLAALRGKGPSAADTLRGGWESEKFVATATRKATIECAVGWPPRMEHPGRLVITIDRGEASHSLPTVALWYRASDKTWALGTAQIEPMRPGDTMSIEVPLGPTARGVAFAE